MWNPQRFHGGRVETTSPGLECEACAIVSDPECEFRTRGHLLSGWRDWRGGSFAHLDCSSLVVFRFGCHVCVRDIVRVWREGGYQLYEVSLRAVGLGRVRGRQGRSWHT